MRASVWKMAIRNLSRNRRRNIATGSAIALGFAGLLAIGSFENRVEHSLRAYTIYGNRTGHLVIYKHDGLDMFETKPKRYGLNDMDIEAIRRITASMPDVELQGAQLIGPGLASNGCHSLPFYAMGISPQLDWQVQLHPYNLEWNSELRALDRGRELWEYPDDKPVVALSTGLARFLRKDQPADPPAEGGSAEPIDCTAKDLEAKLANDPTVQLAGYSWNGMLNGADANVVAVFHTANPIYDSAAVRMPIESLRNLYSTKGAAYYSIWLRSQADVDVAYAELKAKSMAGGLNVDIYKWSDGRLSPHYAGTSQFTFTMSAFIACIIACVVILSVFNAASMTVIERSQEIGMMRSLGFTRRRVRILFVIEMIGVCCLSILAGGLFGAALIAAINAAGWPLDIPGLISGLTLRFSVNLSIIFWSAIAVIALAMLSSLFAVWAVAKQSIAVLLSGSNR